MDVEEKVDELVVAFHDAINILCSAVYTDPSFNVHIYGYGFNGTGVPIGILNYATPVSNTIEEECDYFGFLSNYGCYAYHVLKNAIAVFECEDSFSYDASLYNDKVVFQLNRTQVPGIGELTLSSRTFCKLNDLYPYLEINQVVRVTQCIDGKQKFNLSANMADKSLNCYLSNIAMVRPKGLFGVEVQLNNSVQVKPFVCQHLGESMQGMKCKFAIHCPEWPQEFDIWLSRKKLSGWPSSDIIEKVTKQGVYLIPHYIQGDPIHGGTIGQGQWKFAFIQAEKELVMSLPDEAKYLYKIVLGFIEPIEQLCGIDNSVLHHCFLHSLFWYLEQNLSSISCISNQQSRTKCVRKFIRFMLDSITKGTFYDYFIPDWNLLNEIGQTGAEKLEEIIQSMAHDDHFLSEVLEDTTFSSVISCFTKALDESHRQDFVSSTLNKIRDGLNTAFVDMVKISYLSTFAKLHQANDIERCIEFHQKVLQSVKCMACNTNIKDWCMRIVSNSLGNLYLAKAQISQIPVTEKRSFFSKSLKKVPTSETFYYIQKAEELLLTSNNIDLISGRVKLANFYYMNHQFAECFELVDEIFKVTAMPRPSNKDTTNTFIAGNKTTPEYFLQEFMDRNIILDVLFSSVEKATLPSFMSKNVSFTVGNLLGLHKSTVYVIDADIYAHFLHAMSQHCLGNTQEAVGILNKLENLWEKTQYDLNEKRNLSYLNMIATCYLEIGDREDGIRLLEKSVKHMSNPRNPARFKLIALKTENTRKLAKTTMSVAVGVAVVATVMGVIKSKLL